MPLYEESQNQSLRTKSLRTTTITIIRTRRKRQPHQITPIMTKRRTLRRSISTQKYLRFHSRKMGIRSPALGRSPMLLPQIGIESGSPEGVSHQETIIMDLKKETIPGAMQSQLRDRSSSKRPCVTMISQRLMKQHSPVARGACEGKTDHKHDKPH